MDKKIFFTNMLRSGVIMDVMNEEQAKIAEDSGASAVMALERIPALIIRDGGIARASDPSMIRKIQKAVTIPVMAKCRIGHISEAKILEVLEVDCIDESEVLTIADEESYIDKNKFKIPFVCGCKNLREALRRIHEGAALIRCKGEPGTGDIKEAVRHLKSVKKEIQELKLLNDSEIRDKAKNYGVSFELINEVREKQSLPVPFFAAGGIATPADAALCMELGAQSVFVGSGIFLSSNPKKRAKAIVDAVSYWNDPKKLAEISSDLGEGMK
ncbi:MAG: pyridoxal 5'-phosphate synthase pdxS subunit [Candidatus Midichloriaceae bacterium]|jgi:pyridoxal 5'-phosphate synthase pdxS subunit